MGLAQPKLTDKQLPSLGYKTFQNRRTAELVFVFVEPIGGGARNAANILKEILNGSQYKYKYDEVNNIEVSEIIKNEALDRAFEEPSHDIFISNNIISPSNRALEINRLQQWGNDLRNRFGVDYLAKQVICRIARYRREKGFEKAEGASVSSPRPLRVAHIIRSIKHDAELDLLRAVYGDMLFVIAITGSYNKRLENFSPESKTSEEATVIGNEFNILTNIDQYDGIENGQRVRKIFYKANLFLKNDTENIKCEIIRFLELLFELNIHSPKVDERMMYEAFSSSLRSTCLSRQVGAALANDKDELISIGWNDIPRYDGGLATDINIGDNSALCKTKGYCNSNRKISELTGKIFDRLRKDRIIKKEISKDMLHNSLLASGLSELIEFSRAIHAEMEAILSAARNGKHGLRKGKLYVTTYPCENCVKHILASGISEIIYIEPYIKSRAKDFFIEFIAEEDEETEGKLKFSQFVGISPLSFTQLYKMDRERKDKQGSLAKQGNLPMPKTSVFIDSFTIYEQQIANDALHHDE